MRQNNYQGALQKSIGSYFNAKSTSEEVIQGINLKGKVAIVTGGNSGIGLEVTKILSEAGATVIVGSRELKKSADVLKNLQNVEIEPLDLFDANSVNRFAEKFLATNRPLAILINNAGVMWVPLRKNEQGIESQLGINYLGHFQLTKALWPAIRKAENARIVNVSSQGHHFAPFDFEDPNFNSREYETLLGYGQSKTATILFSMLLAERAKPFNINVYSVHPGSINGTDLGREASVEMFHQMGFCDADGNLLPEVVASLKNIPQGAATTIWCATNPMLNNISGVYCEDVDVATIATEQTKFQSGVMPYALDKTNAERLWKLSEKMTTIQFEVK